MKRNTLSAPTTWRHLFALGVAVFLGTAAIAAPLHTVIGYVPAVSDGDTFYVEVDGRRTRVRLSQIDAPESHQAFGRRSEQSLREMVWKERVTVSWSKEDQYGRPLVSATVNGLNVEAEQVRRGYAWVYRRYATDMALYPLEESARAAKRGLWADPSPQPLWEWRKERRNAEQP